MRNFKIYCGGEFIETSKILDVNNPYNNEVFAKTYYASDKDLENAIAKAQEIQEKMKMLPSYKKYKVLKYISDELVDKIDYLAEILSLESGKPLIYSKGEIMRSAQTFLVASEECKRLPGEIISLDWTDAGEGRTGEVRYFPVGLIAGISPFNFPMNLAVHKIAPAIASGCPIILKPSSNTPLSTLALAKIIDKTDLPKGAVSILPMDRKTGNKLVVDDRFKLLSFTGSPNVGWVMKANAGKKNVILELGGNAGLIITKTSDLENATDKAVIGGFAYSGQVCIRAQRIYVAEEIFEKFSELFIKKINALRRGDPMDESTQISSMIDENNAIRVEQWVQEAIDNGAKVICGGKREGTYYQPTVLVNTKPKMKVCSMEIFGPVVTLEKFNSFEEAIYQVNNSEFGLQAGVFTNNISEMDYAFNKLEVGGVIINDSPIFRVDHMPYGGIKNSGIGREGIKYAIIDMMEAKILVR